jgi:hypothetical protein
MTNEEAHRLARNKNVSRPFYALVKALMVPFTRLHFGLRVNETDRVPRDGSVSIAPNHKREMIAAHRLARASRYADADECGRRASAER